jgi:hypothetical protein
MMTFLSKMLSIRRIQLQVLRAVIRRVVVQMMDPLLWIQPPPKHLLHH